MAKLFEAFKLKNHTLRNRLVVSPMCQYSAVDGAATNWHLVHLGQYAAGGVGAIIQEATAVRPEGRISYADLGLWDDSFIPKLAEITSFIKEQGALAGIQLAHAGRKGSEERPWLGRKQFAPDDHRGWQTISATDRPFHHSNYLPQQITKSELSDIVAAFGSAARRAVSAGYDIIEIHAAHGYLIHQFYSPLINDRQDEYGGSFENRTRFLFEIVAAVQQVLDTQSLWVRISATDWAEGGWDLEQSIELTKRLKAQGVEVIDVSTGGGVHHQKIPVGPKYQVPFAAAIRRETGMITGTVGLINSGLEAEEILQAGEADLILGGRIYLENPHFALQAAKELGVEGPWAPQYERGKEIL